MTTRERGYYWVNFEGTWIVAELDYDKDQYELRKWYLYGIREPKTESSFQEIGAKIELPS